MQAPWECVLFSPIVDHHPLSFRGIHMTVPSHQQTGGEVNDVVTYLLNGQIIFTCRNVNSMASCEGIKLVKNSHRWSNFNTSFTSVMHLFWYLNLSFLFTFLPILERFDVKTFRGISSIAFPLFWYQWRMCSESYFKTQSISISHESLALKKASTSLLSIFSQ